MSFKVVRNNGALICYGPNEDFYQPKLQAGWVITIEDTEPSNNPLQIKSVKKRQGRLALNQLGLLDDLEAWIAAQPRATQIWYQDAENFEIDNPMVIQAANDLGWNNLQDLFNLAATL